MEDREILEYLVAATMPLLADIRLGRLNVRERAVMHRLAVQLQQYFPDWDVDTEYNRHGDEVKRLQRLGGGGEKSIEPDILVHIMGERLKNLLVVELKLANNNDFVDDIFKLEGLTHPDRGFAYPIGVHLQLDFPHTKVLRCTVFKEGAANEDLTAWLRDQFEGALTKLEMRAEELARRVRDGAETLSRR